jgi:hypothetical protein
MTTLDPFIEASAMGMGWLNMTYAEQSKQWETVLPDYKHAPDEYDEFMPREWCELHTDGRRIGRYTVDKGGEGYDRWDPLTKWAHAGVLFEAMAARGWEPELGVEKDGRFFCVSEGGGQTVHGPYGVTAPEAITRHFVLRLQAEAGG